MRSTTPEWDDYATGQAEAYLKRVRDLHHRRASLAAQVEEARDMLDGIKAVRYDGQGGGGSNDPDGAMLPAIARLEASVKRFGAGIAEIADLFAEATDAIARLDDDVFRELLTVYYVQGETWQAVADSLGYGVDNVYKLRTRALLAFYDVMPHGERDPRHPAEI